MGSNAGSYLVTQTCQTTHVPNFMRVSSAWIELLSPCNFFMRCWTASVGSARSQFSRSWSFSLVSAVDWGKRKAIKHKTWTQQEERSVTGTQHVATGTEELSCSCLPRDYLVLFVWGLVVTVVSAFEYVWLRPRCHAVCSCLLRRRSAPLNRA